MATLRVPSSTFLDPDATRPPGLPNPGPPHTAMAFLLERGVAISDVVALDFFQEVSSAPASDFSTLSNCVSSRIWRPASAPSLTASYSRLWRLAPRRVLVRVLLHRSGRTTCPCNAATANPRLAGQMPDCRRVTSCRLDPTQRRASPNLRRSGCSASDC